MARRSIASCFVRAFLVPALVALLACSASSEDAPQETGGARAEDGVRLSWSFEAASRDCNGWRTMGATSIRSVPARTGSYACKLCSDGSAPELALTQAVGPLPEGRYVVRAWVRAWSEEEALAPRITLESGAITLAETTFVTASDAWTPIETTVDVGSDASDLEVAIRASGSASRSCVLVDDVEIVPAS